MAAMPIYGKTHANDIFNLQNQRANLADILQEAFLWWLYKFKLKRSWSQIQDGRHAHM